MTVIRNVIEIIVVTLCLPLYALVFPLMRWGQRSAAQRIQQSQCPSCGRDFSNIVTDDLTYCGVRLRLTFGTSVQWDRLPKWRVTCKSCSTVTCFDRDFRVTACDMSAAVTRRQMENQTLRRIR